MKSPKHILIIKNDGLGDLILVAPLLAELARRTGCRIDLLTCLSNKPLVDNFPFINHAYYVSRDDIKFSIHQDKINTYLNPDDQKLIDSLQEIEFDMAISLRRFIRQSSLFLMTKISAKEKYSLWQYPTNCSPQNAAICSHDWTQLGLSEKYAHTEYEYYKKLLTSIFSLNFTQTSSELSQYPKYPHTANKHLAFIIAGSPGKYLPLSFYQNLIANLLEKNWEITLFGGNSQQELFYKDALLEQFPEIKSFTGQLAFCDHYPHLQNFEIVIGQDTGLSHFAASFHPRFIALCGEESSGRFWRQSQDSNALIVTHQMSCSDCITACEDKPCMLNFSAVKVLDIIENYDQYRSKGCRVEMNPEQTLQMMTPLRFMMSRYSDHTSSPNHENFSVLFSEHVKLLKNLQLFIKEPVILNSTDCQNKHLIETIFSNHHLLSTDEQTSHYIFSFSPQETIQINNMLKDFEPSTKILPLYELLNCYSSPSFLKEYASYFCLSSSRPSFLDYLTEKHSFKSIKFDSIKKLNEVLDEMAQQVISEEFHAISLSSQEADYAVKVNLLQTFIKDCNYAVHFTSNEQQTLLITGLNEPQYSPHYLLFNKESVKPVISSKIDLAIHNIYTTLGKLQPYKIAFYGAGSHTKELLTKNYFHPHEIVAVIDDNAEVDSTLCGYKVYSKEALQDSGLSLDFIIISSDTYEPQMRRSLEGYNYPQARGLAIYANELFALNRPKDLHETSPKVK